MRKNYGTILHIHFFELKSFLNYIYNITLRTTDNSKNQEVRIN